MDNVLITSIKPTSFPIYVFVPSSSRWPYLQAIFPAEVKMAFPTDEPPLGGARFKLGEIANLASCPAHALVNKTFNEGFVGSQRSFYNHRAVGVHGNRKRPSFRVPQAKGDGLAGIREGPVHFRH